MEALIHHVLFARESLPFTREKGSRVIFWGILENNMSSQASHSFRHLFWLWVECERSSVSKYRVESRDTGILFVPIASVLNLGHFHQELCPSVCDCAVEFQDRLWERNEFIHRMIHVCLQLSSEEKYIGEDRAYLY